MGVEVEATGSTAVTATGLMSCFRMEQIDQSLPAAHQLPEPSRVSHIAQKWARIHVVTPRALSIRDLGDLLSPFLTGSPEILEEQRFPESCFVRPGGDNVGYAKNGSLWRVPI